MLQQVGVEAVVASLGSFVSDVDKINASMEGLGKSGNKLEDMFDSVSDSVLGFGREILNVAEVALGVLLRDAFNWVIETLKELALQVFNVSSEFQQLRLRLQGFNLQDAIDSGVEYTEAMRSAIAMTQEQLDWIMQLAAVTPFDAVDIADTYTLARSYGFADEKAQQLTKNILDFTAAMGLSSVESERIIVNLGQMAQRGKITTREMNDLARGAFVPLADVLERVAEKMGLTTAELTTLISKPGGGVDYQLFIDAFNEMIEGEARFVDGAQRMARTFKGASENIVQSIRDIIGYYIIMPGILDPLGERLAGFMDEVALRWDDITEAAGTLGETIGNIFTKLLDIFMPDSETAVDGLIGALNRLNVWLLQNEDEIVGFFENIATVIREDIVPWITDKFLPAMGRVYTWFVDNWPAIEGFFMGIYTVIRDDIVPWVRDHLVPAFNTISKWVDDNRGLITEFFTTLGEIIGDTFAKLFGIGEDKKGEGLDGFLETVKGVMEFIIANEENISTWAATFIKVYAAVELAKLALKGLWDYLLASFFTIGPQMFGTLAANLAIIFSDKQGYTVGEKIIDSIVAGVVNTAIKLVTAVINAIISALNAATSWLSGYTIPSIGSSDFSLGGSGGGGGQGVGQGGANGGSGKESKNSWGSSVPASSSPVARVTNASGQTIPQTVMNLTINSNATRESVVQDYRLLQNMVAA